MSKILIMLTHGSEDPTRAGLAFHIARGAVEAGHQPSVVLAGDAAVLANKTVADAVLPVGLPPLAELMKFAIDNKIPVFT